MSWRLAVLGAITACAALLFVLPVLRRSASDRGSEASEQPRADELAPLAAPPTARGGADGDAAPFESAAVRDAVTATAAPAPTCLVRVVDAATKASVPEARVWIQRADVGWDDPEWWRAMRRFNDVEPVLQSGLGEEHALDERGMLRVPRPDRALSIAAALGDLHGEAELGPDDAECVVELERYHALTVEVVDRAGDPVPNAFVALFWGELDPLEGSHFLPADDEGRLFVPKLEAQIWEEGYRGPLRVTLAGGVPCTPELVELSMEDLTLEPVRLVAGDFGTVVVQLSDARGKLLAMDGMAYVEIDTDPIERPSLALRASANLFRPFEGGRAVFSVGLGFRLEIGGRADGHPIARRDLAGPDEPARELRVLIPVGERLPRVRGRVRLESAEARPGGLWLHGRGARRGLVQGCRVADDGSFEAPLYNEDDLEPCLDPWVLELRSEDHRVPLARATAAPRMSEERVLDFGDVRFANHPVLGTVRVVDPSGVPVAHAGVQVGAKDQIRHLHCGDDGACLLAGEPAELPWTLQARSPGWLPSAPAVVRAPGAEIELVLRRGATLVGRLLLPERVSLEDLRLDLGVEDGDLQMDRIAYTWPVEGGGFQFSAVEPGRSRLEITCDGWIVHERAGIDLADGETTELEPIDLRDSIHPFTLTFELASGEPWSDGHLEVLGSDGELSTWARIGPSGRASFVDGRPSIDLWACGKGARAQLFEGVLDGDRLVLPEGHALAVRVASAIEIPETPLALMLRAWSEESERVFEPDEDVDPEATAVGADRSARLRVPYPGEYELEWYVLHTGTGVEFAIEPEEPQIVRVDEDAGGVVLDALLDAESVQRALRAARGE